MRRFLSLSKQRSDAAKQETEKRRAAEQKRKAENGWHPRNWNWTAIATCVMAVFTAGIYYVGLYQWHTFQGQLSVMQGQLRLRERGWRPRLCGIDARPDRRALRGVHRKSGRRLQAGEVQAARQAGRRRATDQSAAMVADAARSETRRLGRNRTLAPDFLRQPRWLCYTRRSRKLLTA